MLFRASPVFYALEVFVDMPPLNPMRLLHVELVKNVFFVISCKTKANFNQYIIKKGLLINVV